MPTTPSVDEFCKILLRTGSLTFGTYKLTSGLSPYYVDLRQIASNPEAFSRTVAMYLRVLQPVLVKRTQRLTGVPVAGVAYAAVVALNLAKPLLYLKSPHREHASERRIEGLLRPGDKVAILDDVVTTGKSIIQAAEAIRAEGGIVDDAVVLLDRQQGGERNLRRCHVKLHAFTTMRQIADKLLKMGAIDEKQHGEIVRQIIS